MSPNVHRSSRSIGSRTPPLISTPIPQEPIVSIAIAKSSAKAVTTSSSISKSAPTSSTKSSSRLHRPSLTSPMNWLGRSSSSASTSSTQQQPTGSKPIRISEPTLQTRDIITRRGGALGSGATVVRTPQEALRSVGVSHEHDTISVRSVEAGIPEEEEVEEQDEETLADNRSARRSGSPPLPPLPVDDGGHGMETSEEYDEEDTARSIRSSTSRASTPSRPTRPVPPVPEPELSNPSSAESSPTSSLRPSMKVLDTFPAVPTFPPVPALPANIPPCAPAPLFDPILLSGVPIGVMDVSKILVTLETCTEKHKVTVATLCSRPSFIASYLQSILPMAPPLSPDDTASVYSRQSGVETEVEGSFHSIFRNHLTTSGLLPPSASTIHIFLDRPSAPYLHILSYLRSAPSTPEHPAMLPRAVQLTSSSSSRLEALLELRDEARYLDLDELYDLCCAELRARHYLSLSRHTHMRGFSSTSSVRGTFRDHDEQETLVERPKRFSKDSGMASSSCSSGSQQSYRTRSPARSVVPEVGWHSPPPSATAPSAFEQHGQVTVKKFTSMRVRPTGDWI